MKKRVILPLLLTIAMLFSNHSIARAQQPIKLWINGSYVQTDTSPLIQNNRTLVPLRVISENLGLQVEWDAETKSVMTYKLIDGRPDFKESLLLTIGDKQVPKPAEEAADTGSLYYELEAPPVIINNRTMVPIRFIAEAYKMPVDWDGANRTVIVGKGYTAPKTKPQTKKPVASTKPLNATTVAENLAKNGFPISNIISYNKKNDVNNLMGKPGQYIGKVNFADNRIEQYDPTDPLGGSIEVFRNHRDAVKRQKYINTIGDAAPILSESNYVHKNYLLRIDRSLSRDEFNEYKNSFIEIIGR